MVKEKWSKNDFRKQLDKFSGISFKILKEFR